jgi:hypothetical protein
VAFSNLSEIWWGGGADGISSGFPEAAYIRKMVGYRILIRKNFRMSVKIRYFAPTFEQISNN